MHRPIDDGVRPPSTSNLRLKDGKVHEGGVSCASGGYQEATTLFHRIPPWHSPPGAVFFARCAPKPATGPNGQMITPGPSGSADPGDALPRSKSRPSNRRNGYAVTPQRSVTP